MPAKFGPAGGCGALMCLYSRNFGKYVNADETAVGIPFIFALETALAIATMCRNFTTITVFGAELGFKVLPNAFQWENRS